MVSSASGMFDGGEDEESLARSLKHSQSGPIECLRVDLPGIAAVDEAPRVELEGIAIGYMDRDAPTASNQLIDSATCLLETEVTALAELEYFY